MTKSPTKKRPTEEVIRVHLERMENDDIYRDGVKCCRDRTWNCPYPDEFAEEFAVVCQMHGKISDAKYKKAQSDVRQKQEKTEWGRWFAGVWFRIRYDLRYCRS